jgi:hypothetical protein
VPQSPQKGTGFHAATVTNGSEEFPASQGQVKAAVCDEKTHTERTTRLTLAVPAVTNHKFDRVADDLVSNLTALAASRCAHVIPHFGATIAPGTA